MTIVRMKRLKLTEAQVKKAVEQYLIIGRNQGRWIFLRNQCGSLLVPRGPVLNKIQFCEAGTADYVVLQGFSKAWMAANTKAGAIFVGTHVTFLEIKSTIGKQKPEQVEFEKKAKQQNCRYFVIRDAGQLESIL